MPVLSVRPVNHGMLQELQALLKWTSSWLKRKKTNFLTSNWFSISFLDPHEHDLHHILLWLQSLDASNIKGTWPENGDSRFHVGYSSSSEMWAILFLSVPSDFTPVLHICVYVSRIQRVTSGMLKSSTPLPCHSTKFFWNSPWFKRGLSHSCCMR